MSTNATQFKNLKEENAALQAHIASLNEQSRDQEIKITVMNAKLNEANEENLSLRVMASKFNIRIKELEEMFTNFTPVPAPATEEESE